MLTVSGNCLSCHPRKVEGNKNGKPYSFTAHRCCIHHPGSGTDPIYVETGETALTPGKAYRMLTRVRAFVVGEGEKREARFQLMTYKDHPPQEINPPSAKEAANA